jgi:hypothetical protein
LEVVMTLDSSMLLSLFNGVSILNYLIAVAGGLSFTRDKKYND